MAEATRQTMNTGGDVASCPDYKRSGEYDGSIPASRWLLKLTHDFKTARLYPPSPELFLESIEMLFHGEAAKRLDSTPRIRRIVEDRDTATDTEVEEVKNWMQEEFPKEISDTVEENLQSEIEHLGQNETESLQNYYLRTVNILRRAHGKDRPRPANTDTRLSGLEEVMLDTMVSAFVKGLRDNRVRRSSLEKDAATAGSLWRSYEIVQATQRSLELLDQIEHERNEKLKMAKMEELLSKQYGRPVVSVLADLDSGKLDINPVPIPKAQPIPVNRQLPAPPTQESVAPFQPAKTPLRPRADSGNRPGPAYNNARPNIPPASTSQNPFVNGSRQYSRSRDGDLCFGCGTCGHKSTACTNQPLQFWERARLREIVYGGNAQSYYNNLVESAETNGVNASDVNQEPEVTLDEFTETSASTPKVRFAQGSSSHNYNVQLVRTGSADSQGQEPTVDLNTFMADSMVGEHARKRTRVEDLVNDDEDDRERSRTVTPGPATRSKDTKRARKGEAKVRELREIIGRKGLGPVNYRTLAQQIQVPINLLDLFQISPDLAKNFKKLSTRVNEKQEKKKAAAAGARALDAKANRRTRFETLLNRVDKAALESSQNATSLAKRDPFPIVDIDHKSFRVPVVVRAKQNGVMKRVALPIGVSQADQGSEINVCSPGLANALKLKRWTLTSQGWDSGLSMNTADGNSSRLTEFSKIDVVVLGVRRIVWVFIRPDEHKIGDLHLLLGLPWLDDVDAVIQVRHSRITIGDPVKGERRVEIQGPLFVPSQEHRLILHPKNPKPARTGPVGVRFDDDTGSSTDADGEDDSGYSSSDADSDTDSEN